MTSMKVSEYDHLQCLSMIDVNLQITCFNRCLGRYMHKNVKVAVYDNSVKDIYWSFSIMIFDKTMKFTS